jgi:hypothetical protein
MNKKLYLIIFLGFLAISFYPYNKSNFVISANKKLVNDTVKALTKEDIMGKYFVMGDGLGYYHFNINNDTFNIKYGACTFSGEEKGKWSYENGIIYFFESYHKGDMDSSFSKIEDRKYYTIRQDSFLVLIENKDVESSYKRICQFYNAGLNVTNSNFLHKKLENYTPVPMPTVPKEYQQKLLKKPIICQVIAIESDTTLTVNVGTKNNVFEELRLLKLVSIKIPQKFEEKFGEKLDDFLEIELIACNDYTSKAKIINKPIFWEDDFQQFVPNIKKLKVGDILYSYYEK